MARTSEEKGGLLVDNHFGVPYWEMTCCSFWMMGSAILEDSLYTNSYFLSSSAVRRFSLLLKVKKLATRSCQGPSGISQGSMGWMGCVALC